jgi:ABC-2 type transport system permease protein
MTIVTIFMSVFSTQLGSYKSDQLKVADKSIVSAESAVESSNSDDLNESVTVILESIKSINFGVLIGAFLFYFIGGYLLYGALFAGIGSAVDNETDTQQFMLPLTIPMIISIALSQTIMVNPDGPAAYWLSLFPLTSPVTMMIRIPFGVPYQDLIVSMVLLILGFLGATWLAAKIYRTGILMYGKKVSYKELWKWISYR